MPLKKYTDFEYSKEEVKPEIIEKIEETSIEETSIEETTSTEDSIKEEVLLAPKDTSNLEIEILEEKIIKFNAGHIKDIMETLKTKYSDTDYFIRKKDNQLHIVKYNEGLTLNINEFVNALLKFYSKGNHQIIEGIKVKGNQNFSIVENMKSQYSQKFIDDLIKLLTKKK